MYPLSSKTLRDFRSSNENQKPFFKQRMAVVAWQGLPELDQMIKQWKAGLERFAFV